jgi:hypothetical protein
MEKYLKLYGFVKTKNNFWIRGDGWFIMVYKPFYATNRWKVELKNHSFLITDQFELAKLMRAIIEDWDLTDFPYNNF